MAYSLVPDSANTVGSDLTAMYDNFVALESSQVVDEGTTADGDYIRFENGWQICMDVIIIANGSGDGDSIETDLSGFYTTSHEFNVSMPQSFTGFPMISGQSGRDSGSNKGWIITGGFLNSTFKLKPVMQSTILEGFDYYILWVAIGRWK